MKKVFMIISILTITVTLSACGGSGKQKEPSKESQKSDKYDYVYYEILNDGDSETPNVEIKYKDKKGKSHILGDGNKKPYIVKDGKKIHVYRPPYMIYGDDDVEGKAVSKDEVTK